MTATTVTTADGLITVTPPEGPEWEVVTQTADVPGGGRGSLVKCRRTAPGEFLFFMAKDYTVPPEQVLPPERLIREVFPRDYARMFEQVKVDVVQPRVTGGREWWEAGFQFFHARMGHVVKFERVTCEGQHVLLVSGEGAPDIVRAHFAALGAWMDGARFATLGG